MGIAQVEGRGEPSPHRELTAGFSPRSLDSRDAEHLLFPLTWPGVLGA